MARITHAARLKILLSEIERLGQQRTIANATSLLHASVQTPDLKATLKAAKHCIRQIKRAQDEFPVFSSYTLIAMQRPFGRLSDALSDEALLQPYNV